MKTVDWKCDDCGAVGTMETNGDPWKAGRDAKTQHDARGVCASERIFPVRGSLSEDFGPVTVGSKEVNDEQGA